MARRSPQAITYGLRFGEFPYLECSSRGDRRFSAFFAVVRGRGGRSIEEIYQAAKVFTDGSTGLGWREAKGRTPVNDAEVRVLYSQLWREYLSENRYLYKILIEAVGLSDVFGKPGHVCQAEELWKLRNEYLANRKDK